MAKYTDYVSDLLERDYEDYEARMLSRRAFKTRKVQTETLMKERAAKLVNHEYEDAIRRVKIRIMENRLRNSEIAYVIGIAPTTLSRWLLPENFTEYRERKINAAIDLLIEALKNADTEDAGE